LQRPHAPLRVADAGLRADREVADDGLLVRRRRAEDSSASYVDERRPVLRRLGQQLELVHRDGAGRFGVPTQSVLSAALG